MSLRPEITVAAIVEKHGRFLIVEERIRHRLVFNQPAGHVEDRETLVDAVCRETREETGWGFRPRALLGTYLWRNPVNGVATMRFAFIGDVVDFDAAQPLDAGIVRTHWLARGELVARADRLRSPLVIRCIDDYLAGQRLPLDSVACLDLDAAAEIRAVNL